MDDYHYDFFLNSFVGGNVFITDLIWIHQLILIKRGKCQRQLLPELVTSESGRREEGRVTYHRVNELGTECVGWEVVEGSVRVLVSRNRGIENSSLILAFHSRPHYQRGRKASRLRFKGRQVREYTRPFRSRRVRTTHRIAFELFTLAARTVALAVVSFKWETYYSPHNEVLSLRLKSSSQHGKT